MHSRPATECDLPTLRAFEQDLIEVERAFDPDLRPAGVRYYDLESLIARDDTRFIVFEHGGSVIACGYAQDCEARERYHFQRYAYICFLYVVPEHRGQGVVQQLIDTLCDWARARGLTHIELGVYSDNAPAVSAYARAGFRPSLTTMVMTLDDGG